MTIHETKRGFHNPDLLDWAETQRIKTNLATQHAALIQRYHVSPFHAAVIAEILTGGAA